MFAYLFFTQLVISVIIQNAMNKWKCREIHNNFGLINYLEHIKELDGSSIVDLSISKNKNFYGDALTNEQVSIKFGDFIDGAIDKFNNFTVCSFFIFF